MNKSDTQIIVFKDINNSIFTLKQGKSYNITKNIIHPSETIQDVLLHKKKYCFKIINCVSTDTFILEYHDAKLRDQEYKSFVDKYLTFNGMA